MYYLMQLAAKCLKDNNVAQLPIDAMKLKSLEHQWETANFTEFPELVQKLNLENLHGATYPRDDGTYLVLYSEKLSYAERNLVIAHEIGHIVLEHSTAGNILGRSNDVGTFNAQEKEAELFAAFLLMPPCIFNSMGIRNARDLSKVAGRPRQEAQIVIYESSFEKNFSNEECLLCEQFAAYISNYKLHKWRRPRTLFKYLAVSAVSIIAFVAIVTFIYASKEASTNETPAAAPSNEQSAVPLPSPATTQSINTAQPTEATSTLVLKARTGQAFHKPDCYHIKNRTNLTELTIEDAQKAALRPCKNCRPLE